LYKKQLAKQLSGNDVLASRLQAACLRDTPWLTS